METDKLLHFLVCFVSTSIIAIITLFLGELGSILCGVCFALGLAFGKECGDSKASGNKWDWLDIVADVAGISFAVLALVIGWKD